MSGSTKFKFIIPVKHCSLINILLLFIVLLTAISSVSAETRYVSIMGSDSPGCGQIDNECASIEYALNNIIKAGDEVKIKPGVYNVGSGLDLASMNHNNLIITAAYTDKMPTLHGNGQNSVIRIEQVATGITISHIKLEHNSSGAIQEHRDGVVLIRADDTTIDHCIIKFGFIGIGILSGRNIKITNNVIHTMGHKGLGDCLRVKTRSANSWQEKILLEQNIGFNCASAGVQIVDAQYVELAGNNFHDNNDGMRFRFSNNLRIRNNMFQNNSRHGIHSIYSQPTFEIEIWSNIINNNNLMGIRVEGPNQINWKLYNNLIYNNCKNPKGENECQGVDLGATGAEFFHNVVYGHNPNVIPGGSINGGSSIMNNAFFNNGTGAGGGNNGGGGSHNYVYPLTGDPGLDSVSVSDPMFINPVDGDFTLQPDSPLIDAGSNAGISIDFDGNSRPIGNYDIGAYEYRPSVTPVSPSHFRIIHY